LEGLKIEDIGTLWPTFVGMTFWSILLLLLYLLDIGILWPLDILCGHYIYFVAIWNILWLFGIFPPFLVCCAKKNLATLLQQIKRDSED
jgi:hypothetical protein